MEKFTGDGDPKSRVKNENYDTNGLDSMHIVLKVIVYITTSQTEPHGRVRIFNFRISQSKCHAPLNWRSVVLGVSLARYRPRVHFKLWEPYPH